MIMYLEKITYSILNQNNWLEWAFIAAYKRDTLLIKLPGILPTNLSSSETFDTADYTKLPVIEDTIAKSNYHSFIPVRETANGNIKDAGVFP